MVLGLRKARRTAVLTSLTVVLVVLLPLSNINVNNALLQPQSAFAQQQGSGQQQELQGNLSGTTTTGNLTGTTTESQAFLTYDNPTYGIFIQYPSDWTASTSALRDYTELIAFYSPLQNLSQPFAARVAISVVQFTQNVSLPEYTEFVLAGVNQSESDLKNSSEATLAGYPGYRIVLANTPFQDSTFTVYHMNTWATIGNRVYHLTYEAEESAFNQHLPEVSQMLESLVITQQ